MTRSTVRSHDLADPTRRWIAATLVAIVLPGCSTAGRLPEGKPMKTLDLWTVIDYLPTRLPFATDKIESALNVVLARDSENEYFTFYKGTDLALSHDVVIETLDLRIKKEQPGTVIIAVSVNDTPDIRESLQKAGASAFVSKDEAGERLYETIMTMALPREEAGDSPDRIIG